MNYTYLYAPPSALAIVNVGDRYKKNRFMYQYALQSKDACPLFVLIIQWRLHLEWFITV
jgi:hypothetical protein